MTKKIAVLVTGLIRDDINYIIKNIKNIKKQLSINNNKVDIYFHTWEPSLNNNYSKNILDKIRKEVYVLLTSPCPEKLSSDYYLPMENPELHTYNVLCMFYAIGQLYSCITKKYDYICRMRNDLYIVDNFSHWFFLLNTNAINYIYPISLWTEHNAANDHFGIGIPKAFERIWKNDLFQIKEDFKIIKECPEKILIEKFKKNSINVCFRIPQSYGFRQNVLVENGKINEKKLNKYMIPYIKELLSKINNSHFVYVNLKNFELNPIYINYI